MADPYITAQSAFPDYQWASPSNSMGSFGGSSSGGSYNGLLGSLGNLLGGALGGYFGGGKWVNPADAAMPYLNQIDPLYSPYQQTGIGAMNQLYGQLQGMGTPQGAADIYNSIGRGYNASPGYQYDVDQATESAKQIGAASGMAGSPSSQLAIANQISQMASRDYDNYIRNILGLYDTGLSGLNNLTNLGYQATGQEAENLGNKANLAYSGQANKNQYNSNQAGMWGNLLGGAGSLLGYLGYLA